MELLIWTLVFVASLAILIKASDFFVDSAEKIGIALGIPPFIVGVTIVAAGTSLPELASSIASVFSNNSEIVVNGVVGSNICNILLILAISAIVGKQIKLSFDISHIDMPMLLGSALMLWWMLQDKQISISETILLLLSMILFVAYSFNKDPDEGEVPNEIIKEKISLKIWGILALSAVFIFIGANYTVVSIEKMAIIGSNILSLDQESVMNIISIGLLALGTSLPELVVSIAAARKGQAEIAVGNVLGSNIFNSFAVMGIPSSIALFKGSQLIIPDSILSFGLPLMLIASVLFFLITLSRQISKWEGAILLVFYFIFVIGLFENA